MAIPFVTRRQWLGATAGAAIGGWATSSPGRARLAGQRVATFRVDVTPPLGHPLLGGNFRRAEKIGDPLYAHGLVFTGGEKPAVVVCLDWCEMRNEETAQWRLGIAAAIDSRVENVLISCVHQHDAPYVDGQANRILFEAGVAQPICDSAFNDLALNRVAEAAKAALADAKPLTHVGASRAVVKEIASSRRVLRPDGTPYFGRFSTCRDPLLREQPEGEIDPQLHSLTFYSGDEAVAVLRTYAVHPMSPYGRGVVSADFVGQARAWRQSEMPKILQVYGTGCAGDVTAGKYNDGSEGIRDRLAERLHDAMVRTDANIERHPVERVAVRSAPIVLPHWDVPELRAEALEQTVRDEKQLFMKRAMSALGLSSLRHNRDGHHVDLQVIDFGPAQITLYPAESFVSYQLQVQASHKEKFLVPLGFGECSPGYIPTMSAVKEGFREEHAYTWVDDTAERRIVDGMTRLLA
jgi:hypothetical protein